MSFKVVYRLIRYEKIHNFKMPIIALSMSTLKMHLRPFLFNNFNFIVLIKSAFQVCSILR